MTRLTLLLAPLTAKVSRYLLDTREIRAELREITARLPPPGFAPSHYTCVDYPNASVSRSTDGTWSVWIIGMNRAIVEGASTADKAVALWRAMPPVSA